MRKFSNILITGGAGFIGSNFIRYVFEQTNFTGNIINADKLTYAGNPNNLDDIHQKFGGSRYFFHKTDITQIAEIEHLFNLYPIDAIVHFAAESHVDRSIHGPKDFIFTNVIGTFNLLETVRKYWEQRTDVLFHHVSTDEVYGSLGETGYFTETTAYDPRSPYSASKASSDHIVKAYFHTYHLPITLSNCSNNYGPYQFPEKLIPLMISNMLDRKPLPVYGDGMNVRDWVYVDDHNSAVYAIISKGILGETYNIGGENEWKNIELVKNLCEIVANKTNTPLEELLGLITYVADRKGHDRRYAIDCSKLKHELGWKQSVTFEKGLEKTVEWYLNNRAWIENIKSGDYLRWIETNYGK